MVEYIVVGGVNDIDILESSVIIFCKIKYVFIIFFRSYIFRYLFSV